MRIRAGTPAGVADTDHEVSATIALQSAVHHFGRLDGAGTVEWCRRALELAGPDGAVGRTARTYLAHGLGYLGRVADAFAAVEGIGGAEGDADDPEVGWLQPRSARGVLRLVEDDLDGARADLAAVGNRAYELGILNIAAFALGYLARAEYLAGAWDDAVGHAERAVAVNDEADWGFTWSTVVGIAVLVPAARGEWAAAEAALDGAAGRYPGGYERSVVAVAMSRARLAEARGDAAGMVAALEPVRSFPIRDAVDEPGFWSWQDLYAEGLVGVGRSEEADEMLRVHEERAAQRGRASSVARLARARGRVEAALGRPERAERAFEQALDAAGRVALPFERAKVELAAGGFLRRVGRRGGRWSCSPPRWPPSSGWARVRTPSGAAPSSPARACSPPRGAAAAACSPRRSSSSPASPPQGGRTGRSPRSWSSASRRSSTTCATSSRSSGSPDAGSWRTW